MTDSTNPSTNFSEFGERSSGDGVPLVNPRPAGLTVVAVIILIMSSMGILTSVVGLANPIIGKFVQESFVEQAKQKPERKDLQMQVEIQTAAQRIGDRYFLPNMMVVFTLIVSCAVMLVGAILVLKGSPLGRKLLIIGCLITIGADLGKTVVGYLTQKETMEIMGDKMPEALAADPNLSEEANEQLQDTMGIFMKVAKIVGLIFIVGWFLVKTAFYAFAVSYLCRDSIKRYFDPPLVADVIPHGNA